MTFLRMSTAVVAIFGNGRQDPYGANQSNEERSKQLRPPASFSLSYVEHTAAKWTTRSTQLTSALCAKTVYPRFIPTFLRILQSRGSKRLSERASKLGDGAPNRCEATHLGPTFSRLGSHPPDGLSAMECIKRA